MINEESVRAVDSSRLNERFGKPIYDTYGFAQLPNLIRHVLTGEDGAAPTGLLPKALAHFPTRYQKVVLLFIDSFGWRFFEQCHQRYPFLKRFVNEGVVSKISTQFPSTTAAHITTIHSGLPVGESGVYEWFYYEPTLDAMIAPLMFSYAGDKGRNTLRYAGAAAKTLLPRQTVYQNLAAQGVKSYVFYGRDIVNSPYTETMTEGAALVPYKTFSEVLVNLGALLAAERERAYFYLYFDAIDAIAHSYGPESPQHLAEIELCFTALESILRPTLPNGAGDTLLLLTADHGQVEVHPETTIYLNQTLPEIKQWLKTDLKGNLLVPAGSARDMFLHIKPAFIDEAVDALSRHLEGRAEVYRVPELMAQGYFGPNISQQFRGRVGDLVVLPYEHESVWWYEKDRFEQWFQGHHGGLTRAEMETILLALPF